MSETGPLNWALLPLRRYAQLSDRSCRAEFWWFFLFTTTVSNVLTLATEGPGWYAEDPVGAVDMMGGWPAIVWLLAMLIPQLTVSVRRMHDIDRTGWWLLLIFIPVLGWFALLAAFVVGGTEGPNRFGRDPKGPPIVDPAVFA